VDDSGELRAQNRGHYLEPSTAHSQFKPLFRWLKARQDQFADALFPDLMLFGEWCFAIHSVHYTRLPDWFLTFDVYDRKERAFFSAVRRNEFVRGLGVELVPHLGAGRFSRADLESMLDRSRLGEAPSEGLYVRSDREGWLDTRAKLVRPEFMQSIEKHWSRRSLETNQLEGGTTWR